MNRSIALHLVRAVLFTAALLSSATLVAAQSTGSLQGTIEDSSGAVIPGVTISVTNVETGLARTVATDAEGVYVVAALPPGRYRLQAHISGFQDQTQETALDVAKTGVVNFRLGVGALAENVSITAAQPMLETSTVSIGHVITQPTVQEIP